MRRFRRGVVEKRVRWGKIQVRPGRHNEHVKKHYSIFYINKKGLSILTTCKMIKSSENEDKTTIGILLIIEQHFEETRCYTILLLRHNIVKSGIGVWIDNLQIGETKVQVAHHQEEKTNILKKKCQKRSNIWKIIVLKLVGLYLLQSMSLFVEVLWHFCAIKSIFHGCKKKKNNCHTRATALCQSPLPFTPRVYLVLIVRCTHIEEPHVVVTRICMRGKGFVVDLCRSKYIMIVSEQIYYDKCKYD